MGIAQFTRQLAQQAIGTQVKDVVDSLRPADAAATSESLAGVKPAATGDNVGSVILGQIQAMQKSLKEDQELVIVCATGLGTLRVLEIYAPSWHVAVLTGIDPDRTVTRVICPMESLQLVCKPMAVQPGVKAAAVRVVAPRTE